MMKYITSFVYFVCLFLPCYGDEATELSRILGGIPTTMFRSRAGVLISPRSGCTGVAIHRRWVATAVHCFQNGNQSTPHVNISEMAVVAPVLTQSEDLLSNPKKRYLVKNVFVYRDRKGRSTIHDYAFIQLDRRFSNDVKIPKYPTKKEDLPKEDEELFIAAFEHGDALKSGTSTLGTAPVIYKSFEQLKQYGNSWPERFHSTTFAAVSPGFPKTAVGAICGGDSGSGLFRDLGNGDYMHLAVTSGATKKCGTPGQVMMFASSVFYRGAFRRLRRGNKRSEFHKAYFHDQYRTEV